MGDREGVQVVKVFHHQFQCFDAVAWVTNKRPLHPGHKKCYLLIPVGSLALSRVTLEMEAS